MFDELVKFFVVLLVVVEPLSLLPILAGLTEGADDAYRRRMSFKAVGISAVVCLLFAVGGTALLELLGISVDAFKIGGGILLFMLAIEMVFARESGVRSITPGRGRGGASSRRHLGVSARVSDDRRARCASDHPAGVRRRAIRLGCSSSRSSA